MIVLCVSDDDLQPRVYGLHLIVEELHTHTHSERQTDINRSVYRRGIGKSICNNTKSSNPQYRGVGWRKGQSAGGYAHNQ